MKDINTRKIAQENQQSSTPLSSDSGALPFLPERRNMRVDYPVNLFNFIYNNN